MKICFVVPHFLPYVGGGEQLFYSIAKGMKERGHEVRVVTCKCFNAKGHQPYKEIDVYYYDWKSLFGHPVVKKADLSEHIKWADIVHTTLYTTATKARRISKKYKKPCVLTIYEVLGNKWFWFGQSPIKALLFDIYERLICLQKFSGYHAISDATKSDYEKFIGKREGLSRVYCSVNLPEIEKVRVEKADLRQYFNLKESETCFLYFGRPAPNKGIYVLERAVERLAEKGQIPANVRFCMILAQEPAGHRKKILERISKNNLNEIIKIRESVSRNELNKMIYDADYVVIPSITEGFGLSATEACGLGKKVIYSNGGSLPEVVSGRCLEFENRNSKDLAKKLLDIFEKGDEAFSVVPQKDFGEKQMIDGLLCIYEKSMKK